jgi:hypothetical protein
MAVPETLSGFGTYTPWLLAAIERETAQMRRKDEQTARAEP